MELTPAVAIPLTMLCTIAAAASAMFATPLFNRSSPLAQPAAGLSVTVVAVLLVYLWRRYLLRRPWSGVGLPWRRSAIAEALLGAVIAAAVVMLAKGMSVLIGAATWASWPDSGERFGVVVLAILSVSIVQQGFPEELLWRGHLWDLLSERLSARTVLVLTSVVFGLLHIVRQRCDEHRRATAVHRQCRGAHVHLRSGPGEDRSGMDGGRCPLRVPHRKPQHSSRAD